MPHFYRTAFKKKVKKIVSIVGVALLIVSLILVVVSIVLRKNKDNEAETSERVARELNPLENELFLLENTLKQKEAAYERAKLGNGVIVVLFNSPDEKIYSEAFPVMKEYGCKGVISLSKKQFPGLKGYMSEKQFTELLNEGWDISLSWNDSSEDPYTYFKELQEYVRKYTGIVCSTAFFPFGSFSKSYLHELEKLNINTVIHHGEQGLPIGSIDGCADGTWLIGAYQWHSKPAIHNHEDIAKYAKCVVYEIGFNTDLYSLNFEEKQFAAMLKVVDKYESELLKIVDIEQARTIFIDKEYEYKKTPAQYETEIEDLKNKIDAKKSEISKLKKELRLPKDK